MIKGALAPFFYALNPEMCALDAVVFCLAQNLPVKLLGIPDDQPIFTCRFWLARAKQNPTGGSASDPECLPL